jgi:ATP-dependent RNA helicase RhlE
MFVNRNHSRGGRSHYPRYAGRGLRSGQGGRRQKIFDPSRFINTVSTEAVQELRYNPTHTFNDFGLSAQMVQNIQRRGFAIPTPIQDQAIPKILAGRDIIGIANTGTGKTAAFLIPLIERLSQNSHHRVLIIAPTRELADQTNQEFRAFAQGFNLHSAFCIGGVSIHGQIEALRYSPQCVIGTPGRLKDLEQRRHLRFSSFSAIVLDEVDRILDMGFIRDITYIVSRLPNERHSLFFSATLPDEVRRISETFLTNPVNITLQSARTAHQINQDIVKVNGRNKEKILEELLNTEGFTKVLVFGGSKWQLNRLERNLVNHGFRVAAIHGNKSQAHRTSVLKQFKTNRLQALIATDIASRGLDIDDVTHVINYDLPQTYEDYIHRIGRTGRANKTGIALTFVD